MKHSVLACAWMACVLMAGCKGDYATGAADEKESAQAAAAVEAYVDRLAVLPESDRAQAPAWVGHVDSLRVLNAEKMGERLKVLVEIKSGDKTVTQYFLLQKGKDGLVVTGVL